MGSQLGVSSLGSDVNPVCTVKMSTPRTPAPPAHRLAVYQSTRSIQSYTPRSDRSSQSILSSKAEDRWKPEERPASIAAGLRPGSVQQALPQPPSAPEGRSRDRGRKSESCQPKPSPRVGPSRQTVMKKVIGSLGGWSFGFRVWRLVGGSALPKPSKP